MKCLVLAGGRGERLWPLSRNNFPKQFIMIQKNHSLFQETIARNLPFCEEFIIVTNYAYKDIIVNQMSAFQGVSYRCAFEEEPRKTTAAIVLACLGLQPSEFVFVVAADHLIGSEGYKEAILEAKERARSGKIVVFGKRAEEIDGRFGYIADGRLYEKPDEATVAELGQREILQNIGLILFQNGVFLNEAKKLTGDILDQCRAAKSTAIPEGLLYSKDTLDTILPRSIEKSILEKTDKLSCVEAGFAWDDIGSLEDLNKTRFETNGIGVVNEGDNITILNQSPHQAVVVNGLDDILVVNTTDAVYVGKKGVSGLLKGILHANHELKPFSDTGTVLYRSWGYREKIVEELNYRVQKVTILPGKTIYEHRHEARTENWTIIQGSARITLDGKGRSCGKNDSVEVKAGIPHEISNNGNEDLIFIETAVGEVHHTDMIFSTREAVTETGLGLQIDPIVKLAPAYKDYLWGGTKLRDLYGKQCDYDIIAESWELSAHPSGNSIIASGRHRGMSFGKYLETVGREVLGWKCAPLQSFPLLIKLIDAKQNLSVQVHPNDDYALENENEYGKNEMWYVIDAEPGSGLYVGFNRDVDRDEVEKRIADNSILDILNFYPTKPGDVFFIPAGTVHAIGKGNLICEIQQSSNSTYRLYDYGRVDQFGMPRELHLEKALDVLSYQRYEPAGFDVELNDGKKQIRCKYFETSIVEGEAEIPMEDDSFHAIVCIGGNGEISIGNCTEKIKAGDSLFIPVTNEVLRTAGSMSVAITKV